MNLIKTVNSKSDSTVKYIFKTFDGLVIEFSYINKDDGKDIICVPCQTMCNVGCKFCHTSDFIGKIECRDLTHTEIAGGVKHICEDLQIKKNQRVLLVSYMGCGEPIYNVDNVIKSMTVIEDSFYAPYTRFAVATSIPYCAFPEFFRFTQRVKESELKVKLHLSLHYTVDAIRDEWMPKALEVIPSLAAADFYKKFTGNAVEIHYALIDGVNDTEQDAILLAALLKDKDFNVKFLFYNGKDTIDAHASKKTKLNAFRKYLDTNGISHEYYMPPGLDIGASCGQFLMDYYLEAQENKNETRV